VDTSSLVESFNMANLNSESDRSTRKCNGLSKKAAGEAGSKKNRRRLLSYRQRRQLQQNSNSSKSRISVEALHTLISINKTGPGGAQAATASLGKLKE
jgi:hypothetical protein